MKLTTHGFTAARAMNKPWSEKLAGIEEEVQRSLQSYNKLKLKQD